MSKLISIIIPVKNEEGNINAIYQALSVQMKSLPEIGYEIIFVNDGSDDKSDELIRELSKNDSQVKYIELSRNFGKEVATSAGLRECKGDAAIIIDADLQHPVSLINTFIEKWNQGFDMVIGVREKNEGEGLVKKLGSILFYRLMNFLGETKLANRATDFRLIDRRVIDEFNKFTERNRITRGLLDWLGFRCEYVLFTAAKRVSGHPAYNPAKLLKLAITSFVSHSLIPLKLAGYLGLLIIFLSAPLGVYIFIDRYILNDPFGFSFSGIAILALVNLFLVGVILSCLGLIAMYIGSIQQEVMNRPMYVVRERVNITKDGK
jgi:dolichol-phosphate mannosyltransferase